MSPEEQLKTKLLETGKTVATAESCCGGLISHRITNVSGSSKYFLGGAVSYSNSAKRHVLGVSKESLNTHGAVSEEVAGEMAEGTSKLFRADYGVSCTGIAGPTGGTPEKPVGLVYIGAAGPGICRVEECHFEGTREEVKAQTADFALNLLLEIME
jgi:nicotinamide-nucleotide amidase